VISPTASVQFVCAALRCQPRRRSFVSSKTPMYCSSARHATGAGRKPTAVTSHIMSFIYFIYLFFVLFHLNVFDYLQGFRFALNDKPVFKNFLKVNGRFEHSISGRVQTPPTILLHLFLHSIRHAVHFTMTEQLIAEYYSGNDQLQVISIPFNIGDERAVETWARDSRRTMVNLSVPSHVIVFVTTHSVPDTGDLWIGQDDQGESIAVTVENVSTRLFYHLY
jgi:hypothetical protein